MPRPVSWLSNLHAIRKTVAASVRSHYGRQDIEDLLGLQPRAAQKVIEMLPAIKVGTSRLVDREVLTEFLERVRDTEDTNSLFQELKLRKRTVLRRKPRSLVRGASECASVSSLPDSVRLERGRLEIRFDKVEELAQAMYSLAKVLQDDGEAFVEAFEPKSAPLSPADQSECSTLFAELEKLEAKRLTACDPAV